MAELLALNPAGSSAVHGDDEGEPMSLDFYEAISGLFDAIFGAQYGQAGILPGSIEGLNGISSNIGIF